MTLARKALLLLLIAIVGEALLLFASAAMIVALLWFTQATGIQHMLGMDTQTSKNYASVSGYLPAMVAINGFSGVLVGAWHRVNCHTARCPRIGRHHMAGGKYVICTPCLRKGPGHDRDLTAERIHEEHRR